MMKKISFLVCLIILVVNSGCVIQPFNEPDRPVASSAPAGEIDDASIGVYTLKPLDPVYIRFSGIAEQQTLDLVIDENGEYCVDIETRGVNQRGEDTIIGYSTVILPSSQTGSLPVGLRLT